MGDLTDRVRSLTGVSTDEMDDDALQAQLDRYRQKHTDLVLEWDPNIGPGGRLVYLSAVAGGWGLFEPCTDTTAGDIGTRMINGLDAAVTGWQLYEDGRIDFDADQSAAGTHFLTAYTYDTYSAAANVLEAMAASRAFKFEVTVAGADTFKPGEAVERLRDMARVYRAQALPVAGMMVRLDAATMAQKRHYPRSRGGNDL